MKSYCVLALLLAVLLLCPVYAEENGTIPTTAPVTEAMPLANVTAVPPLPAPEPVTSGIPATPTAPTNAPTAVPTAVPTDMMTVALTTIALPPHEQDSGQGVPSDLGIPGLTGFDQNPLTGTGSGLTSAAGANSLEAHPPDPLNPNTCGTYTVQCKHQVYHFESGPVEYGCNSNCVTSWEKMPGCDTCWQSKTTCTECFKSEKSDWDFNLDCTGTYGFLWFIDWYVKGPQTGCSGHKPIP